MLVCGSLSLGMTLNILAQEPHPFGGITLMRVDNSEVLDALTGADRSQRGSGSNRFLLTVVAGNQSYASAPTGVPKQNASTGSISCLSWITAGPDASGQIVLGSGEAWHFRDESRQLKNKYICAEFGLRRQGAKQAVFSSGNLRAVLPIVENFPIIPIDWSDPSISAFRFYGAGLGTVTLDEFVEMSNRSAPRGFSRAQIIEQLQRQSQSTEKYAGALSRFALGWDTDDGNAKINFSGLINIEQMISSGRAEVPYAMVGVVQKKPLLKTLFKEALIDRYGPPTASTGDPTGSRWFTLIWIHDLQGRLITEDAGNNNPGVQSIVKYGFTTKSLYNKSDMGPWGFGVVMSVDVTGRSDMIQNYGVSIRHGHALAHHHFSSRLQMISYIQGTIKDEKQFTPEF